MFGNIQIRNDLDAGYQRKMQALRHAVDFPDKPVDPVADAHAISMGSMNTSLALAATA